MPSPHLLATRLDEAIAAPLWAVAFALDHGIPVSPAVVLRIAETALDMARSLRPGDGSIPVYWQAAGDLHALARACRDLQGDRIDRDSQRLAVSNFERLAADSAAAERAEGEA